MLAPTSIFRIPRPACLYKHYKGGVYQVNHVAKHTETNEAFVIYHNVENPNMQWARPLTMFNEYVDISSGKSQLRFEEILENKELKDAGDNAALVQYLSDFCNFDFDGFIEIHPFNNFDSNHALDLDVVSDHTEICICLNNGGWITSWNISNPKYHTYFKYGTTFKNTHLYVETPYVDNKLISSLEDKIKKQLHELTFLFTIQVIIEGYDDLYNQIDDICIKRIQTDPEFNYRIIRYEPTEENFTSNISGILIDARSSDILDAGIETITYTASEDNNKEKSTIYPYAHLRDKLTGNIFTVIAAHVNGCASQYPVSGLEALKKFMLQLSDKYDNGNIIAIGDFNTPPMFAKKIFNNSDFNLVTTNYLTHCNPNSQACKYDFAVLYPKSFTAEANELGFQRMSKYSQALVKSINKAIKQ